MKLIASFIICTLIFAANASEKVHLPPLKVQERFTPWGTVRERLSYYEKNGEKIEHGAHELFSANGAILESRILYSHGKEDGISEFFYEGTGAKKTEMSYLAGVQDGPCRTWAADGKLLFEGTWKAGKMENGWSDQTCTSSSGNFHRRKETWNITQWKNGKQVQGSKRQLETSWQTWIPGNLPDHKMFLRWNWPSYEVTSNYPFLERMPAYADVPFLIKCFETKAENYQEATDQLEALTRVQFGNPMLHNDAELVAAAAKWHEWWEDVGKHRPALQQQQGIKDPQAWDLAKSSRNLAIPDEPMVIPETYVLEVHFRSGDYGAVTSETLAIHRHKEGAELTRKFSTVRDGPITEEKWATFNVTEADHLVRAVGYLIDRPWLINDEEIIEKRYWAAEKNDSEKDVAAELCDRKVKGRESYGETYYPTVSFELRDSKGKIWWNADPDSWYGENPERFNQTHQPVPGTVYPFLAALYPESTRFISPNKPGWVAR